MPLPKKFWGDFPLHCSLLPLLLLSPGPFLPVPWAMVTALPGNRGRSTNALDCREAPLIPFTGEQQVGEQEQVVIAPPTADPRPTADHGRFFRRSHPSVDHTVRQGQPVVEWAEAVTGPTADKKPPLPLADHVRAAVRSTGRQMSKFSVFVLLPFFVSANLIGCGYPGPPLLPDVAPGSSWRPEFWAPHPVYWALPEEDEGVGSVAPAKGNHGSKNAGGNEHQRFQRRYYQKTNATGRKRAFRQMEQELRRSFGAVEQEFRKQKSSNELLSCTSGPSSSDVVPPPVECVNHVEETSGSTHPCIDVAHFPSGRAPSSSELARAEVYHPLYHGPLPSFRLPAKLAEELAAILAYAHGVTAPDTRLRNKKGEYWNPLKHFPKWHKWAERTLLPELLDKLEVKNNLKLKNVARVGFKLGTAGLLVRAKGSEEGVGSPPSEEDADVLERFPLHTDFLLGKALLVLCPVWGDGTLVPDMVPAGERSSSSSESRSQNEAWSEVLAATKECSSNDDKDCRASREKLNQHLLRKYNSSCLPAQRLALGQCFPVTIPAALRDNGKSLLVLHKIPRFRGDTGRGIAGSEDVLGADRGRVERVVVVLQIAVADRWGR